MSAIHVRRLNNSIRSVSVSSPGLTAYAYVVLQAAT